MSISIWKNRNSLFIFTALISLVALFLPGTVLPEISNRSLYHLWESGHFFLFFLGCLVLQSTCPWLFDFRSAKYVVFFSSIVIFSVLAIEGLQSFISDKSLEISDIIADIAGVVLYFSYRSRYHGKNNFFLHGSALLLISFVFWPVFSSFTDEILAKHQFPLLADFETPFEGSRFEGTTGKASISDAQAFTGQRSLQLSLYPGPWSGMMLKHFPGNWLGFTQLHFAVYNPASQPVSLHVRIHDAPFENGDRKYSDLYSKNCSLPSGVWTKVGIPLSEVKIAPETRRMDLASIRGLGFFVEKEEKPLTLYLDSISLE